jgi:hypothetical protein
MDNKQPEAEVDRPETPPRKQPNQRPPEHPKPVPDGEAIADVGDAVGGPA